MDSIDRIKQLNEQRVAEAMIVARHKDLLDSDAQTQEVILRSFQTLIEYLANKVGKTEVVNQLQQIRTPDVLHVVNAVEALNETVRDQEDVDLTEITSVLQQVLDEAKKIPKELPEFKERESIDYSDKFKAISSAIAEVEKAVKAQKLIAKAPIVNVPETQINVEKPDLSPITKELKDVTKSVKANKLPEVVKTVQLGTLLNFEFDEYKVEYDEFNDDNRVEATVYYQKGKKVAKIKYSYDSEGNLTGGKRV